MLSKKFDVNRVSLRVQRNKKHFVDQTVKLADTFSEDLKKAIDGFFCVIHASP